MIKRKLAILYNYQWTYSQLSDVFNLSKSKIMKYLHIERKWFDSWSIRMRDKWICQWKGCYRRKNLNVHHLDHDPSNSNFKNLITLCRMHHGFLHQLNHLCIICSTEISYDKITCLNCKENLNDFKEIIKNMNTKEIAKYLGQQGGRKTLAEYGREHFKKIQLKGAAAKVKKRKILEKQQRLAKKTGE